MKFSLFVAFIWLEGVFSAEMVNPNMADPQSIDMVLNSNDNEAIGKLLNGADIDIERKGDETEPHVLCQTKLMDHPPKRWENKYVPYYLQKDGFTEDELRKLDEAVATWNEQVPEVRFVKYQGNDTDFVYVTKFKGVCASTAVGEAGGPQFLLMGPECLDIPTIHHEMMHVIGFEHEHSRKDRDQYVKVLFRYIPEEYHNQYEKVNCRFPNLLGPYDYYSNMHYKNVAPDPYTRLPAFKALQPVDKKRFEEDRDLSDEDKKKIKKFYGMSRN